MQEAKGAGQAPGRGVALLRDELGCLSQADRGDEDQNKPGTAADKSRGLRLHNPRHSRNQQHGEGGNAPAAIQSATSPGLGKQDQRRDTRDEEEDVVEIEHDGRLKRG